MATTGLELETTSVEARSTLAVPMLQKILRKPQLGNLVSHRVAMKVMRAYEKFGNVGREDAFQVA